jgi:hypothetical protein
MISSPLQFQTEQQARSQLILPKPIAVTPLGTTASVIYTADAVADFWIVHLWVTNTTGSAVTYTVHFVPPSGTAAVGNRAVSAKSLAANTSEVIDVAVNHRIAAGSTVQALCSSANAVNIGGWGYDFFGEYA